MNHDISTNSHATNTIPQNIQKRSIDASMEDIAQVTVSKLKKQVDDLVDNYNKLAKTLNRPLLHETNTKDESHITRKAVSLLFFFLNVFLLFVKKKTNNISI